MLVKLQAVWLCYIISEYHIDDSVCAMMVWGIFPKDDSRCTPK